ncbi:uncharacterized protein HD556DRAFT_1445572 [Suillus plorans]|uniref:Uncharacterized protein n=1 Tax=Suillus plorans TaxID=116603 RepID=A0A9P7DFT4_9AGAM|nr:uncharacterized protein HD556DRAFT_1445572 [Suillus plorans]KAG1791053.1 hypothetical protein HD556DRAFT_1445572 [Suillus plorans]
MPRYCRTVTFVKPIVPLSLIAEAATIFLIQKIVPHFIIETLIGLMALLWTLAVFLSGGRRTRRFMQAGSTFDHLCTGFTFAWGYMLWISWPNLETSTVPAPFNLPVGLLATLLGAAIFVYSVAFFSRGNIHFRHSLFGQYISWPFQDVEEPPSNTPSPEPPNLPLLPLHSSSSTGLQNPLPLPHPTPMMLVRLRNPLPLPLPSHPHDAGPSHSVQRWSPEPSTFPPSIPRP